MLNVRRLVAKVFCGESNCHDGEGVEKSISA